MEYLEKEDINGVNNNVLNYRKYLIKNTNNWLIPIKKLNIEERKTGNKLVVSDFKKKVVVKISKNEELMKKDYETSLKLYKLKSLNFINYLGFFSCFDNIDNYNNVLPKYFCKKNGSMNYFIFMDYFPLGSLQSFTPSNIDIIISIINQVLLSLTYAFEKTGFIHGDLHPGNILVKKTKKEFIKYKNINFKTHGYLVKIFDFDRSSFENNFPKFLTELSFFINSYDLVIIEKKIFHNKNLSPLFMIKKEFIKITKLEDIYHFIG